MPPRPILHSRVFLTRRVAQRRLRLLPSTKTTRIFTYLLAVLAKRHRIAIHGVCAMSNHWHAVLSDPRACLPEFTGEFHSMTARHINYAHGDRESLWNGSQPSHVIPETAADLLEQIAYTMANPTAAGLVEYGHQWPGLRAAFGDKPITVKRPKGFLREVVDAEGEDLWPETATLTFARPPGFDELGDGEVAALIKSKVLEAEAAARGVIYSQKRTFMGRDAVLRQGRWARGKTYEPLGRISPRVKCRDKWRRIERLRANKEWLDEYKRCRLRFAAGERDVVFPHGTYQMRIRHNVKVAPA